MMGATEEATPAPLAAGALLRVKDMAANGVTGKGAIVAVGYHETGDPGQLNVAFSIDGGKDYRRTNGNLRRYPVVGDPLPRHVGRHLRGAGVGRLRLPQEF